jgi:osmotically-inducible protein OsmY
MAALARLLGLVPRRPPANQAANRVPGRDELFSREPFSLGFDDSFIKSAVKNALLREAELAHAGIHVSTSRGVVQLSGFVESRGIMSRAVAVVRAVEGVRSVRNDMRRR